MVGIPSSQRRCIFCQSTKNITHEHIVPNWLRKVFPAETSDHSSINVKLPNSGPIGTIKTDNFDILSKKLNMVCRSCNNGWMQSLQDKAIPILTPLINGDWLSFSKEQANIVSIWTAMTASVISVDFQDGGVTRADRMFLKENKKVPKGWAIWIGRGSGFGKARYSNCVATLQNAALGSPIENLEPNTAITTIALGKVILHSVNVPIPEIEPDPVGYGRVFGVFPIHPWGGGVLDWKFIPIMSQSSPEFERLRIGFLMEVVMPLASTE